MPCTYLLPPGFDGVIWEHAGGGGTPKGGVSQAVRGAHGPFCSKGWGSESTARPRRARDPLHPGAAPAGGLLFQLCGACF